MTGPDFSFEEALIAQGLTRIAGVDEVGRGPLAGPVTAAAVVLDPAGLPEGLNDSKVLTARRREALLEVIMSSAEPSSSLRATDSRYSLFDIMIPANDMTRMRIPTRTSRIPTPTTSILLLSAFSSLMKTLQAEI